MWFDSKRKTNTYKVMKAPEKIYLQPLGNNEIYNHWYTLKLNNDFIEYTRTDTLELKKVDLEKEFYDFLDTLIGKDNGHLSEYEVFCVAEYFFELGLKVKGE